MKKHIILILALFLGFQTFAQNATITRTPESKNLTYNSWYKPIILGQEEGTTYLATYLYGAVKSKGLVITAINEENEIIAQTEIENSESAILQMGNIAGDQVVFLCSMMIDNQYTIRRYAFDKKSLKQISSTDVISLSKEVRRESFYCKKAISENRQHFVLALVNNSKTGNTIHNYMFSPTLELQWHRELEIESINSLLVSNEGEIANLTGYRPNDWKEEETLLIMNLCTEDFQSTFKKTIPYQFNELQILNYNEGKFLMAGVVTDLDNSSRRHDISNRVATLVYNIKNEECNLNITPFSSEEIHTLSNEPLTKKLKNDNCDAVCITSATPTSNGGAFLLQRKYAVSVRTSNGMVTTTYYSIGNVLLTANWNGQIVNHVTIPRNVSVGEFEYLLNTILFTHGDDLYMLTKESAKTPATYDKSITSVKPTAIGKAEQLVLYRIAPDGNVTKQLQDKNSKLILMSEFVPIHNGFLGIEAFRASHSFFKITF